MTLMVCFCAAMVALAVAFVGVPAWRPLTWYAIGVLSATAALVGAGRHAARRPWPWRLLAIAILVSAAGDLASLTIAGSEPVLARVVATVLGLATVPPAAAAVIGLARSGSAARDRAGVVDALTITTAAALLAWVLVIPTLPGASGWDRLLVIRLARRRHPAPRAPSSGSSLARGGPDRSRSPGRRGVGRIDADTVHGVALAGGGGPFRRPRGCGLAWFGDAAWGAAGLHRPWRADQHRTASRSDRFTVRRWLALTLTAALGRAGGTPGRDGIGDVRDGSSSSRSRRRSSSCCTSLASVTDAANAHGRSLHPPGATRRSRPVYQPRALRSTPGRRGRRGPRSRRDLHRPRRLQDAWRTSHSATWWVTRSCGSCPGRV